MNKRSATGLKAYFSPAERAAPDVVVDYRRKVLLDQMLITMLEAIPDSAFVLNRERQVLAVNTLLLQTFGINDGESLVGKRPGEALGCLFCAEGAGGCGTGLHCTTCGAVKSILGSQQSRSRSVQECRITIARGEGTPLDLEVTSTPVTVDDINLTVCILRDISAEKRRDVLERVFFHDVMNTAGGIRGIAALLVENKTLDPEKEAHYKLWMMELSEKLIDEVTHQRKLLSAEMGEFKPNLGTVCVRGLMSDVHGLYLHHDIAEGRALVLDETPDCTILSDAAILRRILGNLVKNALEAVGKGGRVTMYARETAETVTFFVHNPGVMAEEVQLQLFQRSFSTKGEGGRGIGTYSVKLFGERYLKGRVAFVSREPEGTTFSFTVPKIFPDLSPASPSLRQI